MVPQLKVLVLETSVYSTGALKSVLALASHLSEAGTHTFEFAMDAFSPAARLVRSRGFPVHHMRFAVISRSLGVLAYPSRLLRNAMEVRRLVAKTRAHVVHVNDIYNLGGLFATVIGSRSFAVVQHCRLLRTSYIGPLFPVFAAIALRWADAIIGVSQAVANDLGISSNIHIVYDALESRPKCAPKVYDDHEQGCRFLYVGNFVRGKGHDVAVAAFVAIAKDLPGSRLDLVGAGARGELDRQYVAEMEATVQRHGLSVQVCFHGAVENVESRMKSADVVLNFSYSESFSMVCLEALSYGLPVIATDCGGPSELIEDGVTGILIPVGQVGSAAAAMKQLAADPSLARRLGEAAAASMPRLFSLELAARRMAEIYAFVVARRRTVSS